MTRQQARNLTLLVAAYAVSTGCLVYLIAWDSGERHYHLWFYLGEIAMFTALFASVARRRSSDKAG